ncbi:MAG TPA: benzoate-CoA ligase family protein [Roseiarcus sp.]|jgi:4-hydroxybenzoate-CoA ligase
MIETAGNAAVYFVDRHADGPLRDKAAYVEASEAARSLTYAELAADSGRVAHLMKRHDIRRESRVIVLMFDQIEFPVVFWGALKAGVVPVLLNTLLASDVYKTMFDDSRACAMFVSHALLPVVAPILREHPHLQKIFVVGGEPPAGALSFEAELAQCESRPAIAVSPDECAFWLYSSGSTGEPKGVRHVHGSLKCTADTYGAEVLQIEQSDVVFSAAKLFFAYGLGNAMTFPLSVGATAVLYPKRPTPEAVFDILQRFKPTIFCGVPTLYAAMVAELEGKRGAVAAPLRRCISAGEALPKEVGERWRNLTGVDILDGVGSTEMLHIFLSNRPGEVVYGSSGVATPGYEVRLVDESGSDVAEGEIGELLVRGGSAAADYWNQRDKTRSTFQGHWTRTGDKYVKLAGGRYAYCGRTDDMFKVSGIWVAPFEVEQALITHPSVLEAAVVPARDADGLTKPKAFVVLKPGAADDADLSAALKEHVKDRIGKWKYPRWIELIRELPKTATGKIQRFKLKEP